MNRREFIRIGAGAIAALVYQKAHAESTYTYHDAEVMDDQLSKLEYEILKTQIHILKKVYSGILSNDSLNNKILDALFKEKLPMVFESLKYLINTPETIHELMIDPEFYSARLGIYASNRYLIPHYQRHINEINEYGKTNCSYNCKRIMRDLTESIRWIRSNDPALEISETNRTKFNRVKWKDASDPEFRRVSSDIMESIIDRTNSSPHGAMMTRAMTAASKLD